VIDEEKTEISVGELDYAGQGTADERVRGTFERDEEEIGQRHDTFSSPFEGDEGAEGEETPSDEEQSEEALVEDPHIRGDDWDGEEAVDRENEEEEHDVFQNKVVDEEETEISVGELDYAGQGTADERVRGTFERDEEEIGQRHDTFSSPFEGDEDAVGEETEEENVGQLDRGIDDEDGTEEENEETIEMEDGEEELVAVHGGVHTVNNPQWRMSAVLLTLAGAAIAALFFRLLRKCDAEKMKAMASENTPLIADEV